MGACLCARGEGCRLCLARGYCRPPEALRASRGPWWHFSGARRVLLFCSLQNYTETARRLRSLNGSSIRRADLRAMPQGGLTAATPPRHRRASPWPPFGTLLRSTLSGNGRFGWSGRSVYESQGLAAIKWPALPFGSPNRGPSRHLLQCKRACRAAHRRRVSELRRCECRPTMQIGVATCFDSPYTPLIQQGALRACPFTLADLDAKRVRDERVSSNPLKPLKQGEEHGSCQPKYPYPPQGV